MNPAEHTCSLADAHRAPHCGGKAASLAQMHERGLPVPPGFVVTDTAFQAFLDHNALRQPTGGISALLEDGSLPELNSAASELRQRILSGKLPGAVEEALTRCMAMFATGKTLIVRSSAIGEDGIAASFAGQLDSILDVDVAGLVPALLRCWASVFSERVLFYQRARGVRLGGMGVIVQEQIQPAFAGVLFTANVDLTAGAADDLLVEYHSGHGEALVQGRIDPSRAIIGRDNLQVRHLVFPDGQSATLGEDYFRKLARAALTVETARGVSQDIEWALDAEQRLWLVQARPITGGHDIRFAKREARCWSPGFSRLKPGLQHQSAPSETESERPAAPASEPPLAGEPQVLWSNANVNENYPDPISPLLYSIASTSYYHYFRNLGLAFGISPARITAMEQPLRQIIGVHGARMYYHLSNIHALLRSAPFGERLANYFSAFTGAESPHDEGARRGVSPPVSGPHTGGLTPRRAPLAAWCSWCDAVRLVLRGVRLFRSLPTRVAEFESTVDHFAERTTPERLAHENLSGLLDAFRGFLDIRFHRWLNASLADAAAMISYGALKHLLRREFPQADQSALHNTLLKGLTELISSAPLTELWQLSRIVRDDPETAECFARLDNTALLTELHAGRLPTFGDALRAYLHKWGFRRSGELMLTVPGFQEDPGPLLDILRSYAGVHGEAPADRLERQCRERTAETKRILEILRGRRFFAWFPWPSTAGVLRRLLHWCQSAIALRERARTRQALLYARCRAIVLVIGRQLVARGDFAQADDVLFLTYQEIVDLLSGSTLFPHHVGELVRLRRKAHAQTSASKPADVLTLPAGTYLSLHPVPPTDESATAKDEVARNGRPAELTGVSACGGKATGPAAVLTDIADCTRLSAGDVLVTRQTDPGWGPAFLLIGGLVLERGGMLSHGAILAREFGIPSVVGVRNAVEVIRAGQSLDVDGDRGVVRLVDR
jgi:phosphohistidine swiveling domain-containing protein